MTIRTIAYSSKEYEEMKDLRIRALLRPIGIPAHYIVPEKEKKDVFIGAFEAGEMIGCCILTAVNNGLVQLRQMAVRPDRQGQKIGAAIIAFAETVAKEKGYTSIMMHARNPVMDFYKKCGYQVAGNEFFEVAMGHHKMEKKL